MKFLLSFVDRKNRNSFLLCVLAAIFFVMAIATVYFRAQAQNVGTSVGEMTGGAVGVALGSADGVINGLQEGMEAGAAAGLSAEDTTADMKESLKEVGRLEVLAAGVTLRNLNEIGQEYTNLSVINGDAIFSVDMTQAEISFSQDGKEVYIVIPEPTMELYIDQSGTEILAEIQKPSFSVTAEDGLNAYLNSMAQTVDKVKETLANYDSLLAQAKDSALGQVRQMAETISGGRYTVHTQYR